MLQGFARPLMRELRQTFEKSTMEEHRLAHWIPMQRHVDFQLLNTTLEAFEIPPTLIASHPHPSDLAWRNFIRSFDHPISQDLDRYFELLDHAPLATFYSGDQVFSLIWPEHVFVNELGFLHHAEHAALRYPDREIFAWNGLSIPARYITERDKITREDILEEGNAERRRALLEILGHRRFAELLDVQVIDQSIDRQGRLQTLYKTHEPDSITKEYIFFAEVVCPSTERHYFLCVPPTMRTAQEAVAWTFGMSEQEYDPNTET